MLGGSGELAEIQAELRSVKQALQNGAGYLGMSGENLQKYLLQLNEKENLLLSQQLQGLSASGHSNGQGGMLPPPAALSPGMPMKAAPAGPAKAFNRDDFASVFQHMCDYEAVPEEGAKALKALSALAYKDAAKGGDDRALQQTLRLLALHPAEVVVQVNVMRLLCNAAYDPATASEKLTSPQILTTLLSVAARTPDAKDKLATETANKAGEALARIIASETCPDGNIPVPEPVLPEGQSPLAKFFLAACSCDPAFQQIVPSLLAKMVANEVALAGFLAKRFITTGTAAAAEGLSAGWLSLARALASLEPGPDAGPSASLPQNLVDNGAIRTAVGVMEQAAGDAAAQLAGVEGLSALVGNRYSGLTSFADSGGMLRIENAMATHTDAELLQTKSIRAMASGVLWAPDVQHRAQYNPRRALELTKKAMARHADCAELQQAGLEAMSKYMDKMKFWTEVLEGGGDALVKQAMARHSNEKGVMLWGRNVLDALGIK